MSADLDKAIDRAVREMLDVEPPADLRARVVARIDERSISGVRRPGAGYQRFGVLKFGAIVAAAATLVLMLLLVRPAQPPAQPPSVARTESAPPPSSVGTAPPIERAIPADVPTAPVAPRQSHPAAATVAAVSVDIRDADGIDPLKRIAPIDVPALEQHSITPEPIDVRPLNPITDVQIAPLNPPEGRD